MFIKKDLTITFFNFKNLKFLYFIPLIFIYILLPLMNYSTYKYLNSLSDSFTLIMRDSQRFIALFSTWWACLVFKQYIESSNKEIINIYKPNKLIELLIITFWYILHCSILFIIYSFIFNNVYLYFIKISIITFF